MFRYYGLNYDPDNFKIWYSPCTRAAQTWVQEIENSAKMIAKTTDKDIYICMSGGVDSEIVAETFKKLGIPFTALITRFNAELNAHDIVYSHRWCEANNVPYVIFDFDMYDFLLVGYKQYLEQGLVSNNVFRYLTIEMIKKVESLNGYAVLGGKSVGLGLKQKFISDFDTEQEVVYEHYDIGSLAPIEWCRKNNLDHCIFFYQTSSEIHQAYLNDPINQFLIDNPSYLRSVGSNESAKSLMVRAHFPHLMVRNKHNGFEKIWQLREACQIDMANYFNLDSDIKNKRFNRLFYNDQISTPVHEILQQLSTT